MADQEEPPLAVIRTKNGLTVLARGMELHYELDPETQSLVETRYSTEPDTTPSELIAFRKAAWKLVLQIARGLGWIA